MTLIDEVRCNCHTQMMLSCGGWKIEVSTIWDWMIDVWKYARCPWMKWNWILKKETINTTTGDKGIDGY